jgi:hypothetical protein
MWTNETKGKNNHQRTMLLTLIGLVSLVVFWPFIFILYISGIETIYFSKNYTFTTSDNLYLIIVFTTTSLLSLSEFKIGITLVIFNFNYFFIFKLTSLLFDTFIRTSVQERRLYSSWLLFRHSSTDM